jgi:hypothetical protein
MAPGLRDHEISKDILDAMRTGTDPYASYKKAILGRVNVRYLDPIRLTPESTVLKGDPTNPDEEEEWSFKVWTSEEDTYFQLNNKSHLRDGTIVPYVYEEKIDVSINQISDEEIELILQKPFFAMKNKLAEFTSPIPVRRFLAMAEKMNRPVGTVNHIKEVLEAMETTGDMAEKVDGAGNPINVIELDY